MLGLSPYHSQSLNQVHLSNIHSQIRRARAPAKKTWAFSCMKKHCVWVKCSSSHCCRTSARPWGSSQAWMWGGGRLLCGPLAGPKGCLCHTEPCRGIWARRGTGASSANQASSATKAPQRDLLLLPHELCGQGLFPPVTQSLRKQRFPLPAPRRG